MSEGIDVYLPTVDDRSIDAVIRISGNSRVRYFDVQIKGSQSWSGIRCQTAQLSSNSVLILYCADQKEILWFFPEDLPTYFPELDEGWGNVFLNRAKVEDFVAKGHSGVRSLKERLKQEVSD
jgi:hypothetical protein